MADFPYQPSQPGAPTDEVTLLINDELQVEGVLYQVKHIRKVQGTEATVIGLQAKDRYPARYINLYHERIL